MAIILSFRDLEVYKLAREQAKIIFTTTKMFAKEEKYSLTDQIRRSSRAVNPDPKFSRLFNPLSSILDFSFLRSRVSNRVPCNV